MDQIGHMIAAGTRQHPGRPAVITRDGQVRTYAEIDERSTRLANALLGSGLARGDRVAAWMVDSSEYLETYVAVGKAGLILVPINARFREHEAEYQISNAGAVALVYSSALAEHVAKLVEAPELRLLVCVGGERVDGAQDYEELLARASPRWPAVDVDDSDPYIIAYTSGTTGFPKGAVLTHRSVKNQICATAVGLRIPLNGVRANTTSMSFTSGVLTHMLATFYTHGTVVLFGPGWDLELLEWVGETYRATHTSVPSPMLSAAIAAVEAAPHRWTSFRSVLHAGSKAPPETLQRFAAALRGFRFVEGWGMTENSGGCVAVTSEQDVCGQGICGDAVFETVGRPLPEHELTVLDDERRPLPHDGQTVGELAVRSPSLMVGYWDAGGVRRDAFIDGWYLSGDLGVIDEHGYVRIVDRRHDMIVSGGMNVYPAEIERVISQHPHVSVSAVTAAPHERWGQTVVAVVVPVAGASIAEEGVIQFCRDRLASYKKPTRVIFVESLPTNMSGKVDRNELRRLAEATGDRLPSR